jgi:hypothetical protein
MATPVPKPKPLNPLVKRKLLQTFDDYDDQIVAGLTALAARVNSQVPAAKGKLEGWKGQADAWITAQLDKGDAFAEDILMGKVPVWLAKLVEEARAAIKAA